MFYQEMHDELLDSDFNPKATDPNIGYDQAAFKKIKIGAMGKLGVKIVVWKKVMFDIYEGLGIAYRHISYTNVINPVPFEELGTQEVLLPESYKNEGTYLLLQLSFGVRVGYIFPLHPK